MNQLLKIASKALLFVGVLLACGAAAPPDRRLVGPYWLQRPSRDDIQKALAADPSYDESHRGFVAMQCVVKADGGLESCAVAPTSRVDDGLRAAALGLAPLFKTKLQDSAGQYVPGALVDVLLDMRRGPPPELSKPKLRGAEARADFECAVAARRHWAEDDETVEAVTVPRDYAATQDWLAKRDLQAPHKAQDSEAEAFYEGRLTVRDPAQVWHDLEAVVIDHDLAGAATNDAMFARCEERMRDLRHLLQVPTPLPLQIMY